MKKIFVFCLVICTKGHAFETTFADSLWNVLINKEKEAGLEFMFDFFYPIYTQNSQDGITWMNTCLTYSQNSNNQQAIGRSNLSLGIAWYMTGDYEKCITHFQSALDIFENLNDKKYIGRTCNELSVYSRKQKQFEQGLAYLDRSFKLCTDCGDTACVETSLNNRAVIYEMMGKYELALNYYHKAEQVAKSINNEVGLAYIYIDAAECYRLNGDYDSCLIYIDKSISLLESKGNTQGVAMNLINKAIALSQQEKYALAVENFTACIQLAEQINYIDLLKIAHYQLGKTYADMQQFEQAVYHIDKSHELRDSLLNQEKIKSLSEMEVKYETEKIENNLLIEQQERIKSELRLANRNKWIIGLSGFFVASIFFGLFLYQRKLKRAQAEKDSAIIAEREKGIQAVFDATEEERQRIAKDLHDGVGQQMSGLKMAWQNISLSIKNSDADNAKRIEELSKILDQAASEVREISHQMMPKVLAEFGLVAAIDQMLDKTLTYSSIKFSFEHYNFEGRINRKIELSLFRISQELLNNVIKHSNASFVSFQLFKNAGQLILIVEDNGKGISNENKDGHGLLNIQSRLTTINGKVNYSASEGAGTTATIIIQI